ncbi:MAG: glycosyltransferase family 4 protein [Bacteroidales bacterium]|jgi:glycosyltransferase involved in cell wall biosynthesis|nr:glycosyltransferase family 4 protein [Bacteroidales bacterium]
MTTKKHIILAGNTAWGMYNFRERVIQALVDNGYKVTVLAPHDDVFTPKLVALSVNFIDTPINLKGTNPVQELQLFRCYKEIFQQENPDFIFFYTIKPNIYGSFAAQRCKIPHIAVTTGLGYTFLTDKLVAKISKFLYKKAFKKTYQVWFLNNDDMQTFIRCKLIDAQKSFILKGEGIDLERFHILSLQKRLPVTFLLIARMLWDKGIGEFIKAARVVKQKYPDAKFQLLGVLGAENPAAIPREQIEQWQSECIIEYLGVTENVKPFIDAATCVVLPSYREGIPLSLLEASASGKPIITTNAIGCKDTVEDGVTGFMCQVKDVADLAGCMEKIICLSSEQYKTMASAGRTKMEKEFDVKLIVKHYLEILDKVIY